MLSHQAVARALKEAGVEVVFGLLGDGNMQHATMFSRDYGGAFIAAVHEGGAVSMADGYARISGRVGVASITHGPAATNCLTGLTEAVRAGSPVVVISGDTPPRPHHVQSIDLRGIAQVAGAAYWRVLAAEHIAEDLTMLIGRAMSTGHPVLVDIPLQVGNAEVDYRPAPTRFNLSPAIEPDPDALDRALGIIAAARRPILLAGRGAAAARAGEELAALAALIRAPVATTLLAKDFMRDYPNHLGIAGTLAQEDTLAAFNASDCVVAFGASLNDFTTVEGTLLRGKRVVRCDVDAERVLRYRVVDCPVIGDARAIAVKMWKARGLVVDAPASSEANSTWLDKLGLSLPGELEFVDTTANGMVDMRTAMIRLDALLPRDRAVVTDAGRFLIAPWRHLHVENPLNFTHTVNFGSIGLGTATGIGAAFACPDQLTVAVVGDGGAAMAMMEFTTAVRNALPFLLIVLNDGSYGAEYTKLKQFGIDPDYSLMAWPEFADVAIALGGNAVTVRQVTDLAHVARMVKAGKLPLVVDIKADPTVDIHRVVASRAKARGRDTQ